MAAPTQHDLMRVQRLGQYLKKRPRVRLHPVTDDELERITKEFE